MWTLFLSYRRDDSAPYAGRIHDRLVAHFGAESVFMDITAIDIGEDFEEAITRTVASCNVLIAVIGPRWLSNTNATGQSRLHESGDFVGIEVATALQRGIRVIPALVGNAQMPSNSQLPENLQRLAMRQAIEISDSRFHQDIDRLIAVLQKMRTAALAPPPALEEPPPAVQRPQRVRPLFVVGAIAVVLLLILIALLMASHPEPTLPANASSTSATTATATTASATAPSATTTSTSAPVEPARDTRTATRETPVTVVLKPRPPSEGLALVSKIASFVGDVSNVRTIGRTGSTVMKTPDGDVRADVQSIVRYPDAARVVMKTPMGDLTDVVSPEATFMITPEGTRDVPDAQRDAALLDLRLDLIAVLKNAGNPEYTFTVGKTEADGRVLLINAYGASVTWIVDPNTGRVVRTISKTPTRETVTGLSNWKTFEGLNFPTSLVVTHDGKKAFESHFTSVAVNPRVDPKVFAKP